MLPAFLVALAWIPALVGLGTLVPVEPAPPLRAPLRGLFGLAVLGALATFANLVVPLRPGLALAAWLLGAALLARRRAALAAGLRAAEVGAVALLLLGLAAVTRPVYAHYDSGLYHLQLVKWAVEAPLPPGLALLHHRFGTASCWAQLCALLELPGVGEGESAAFAALLPSALACWAALAARRLGPLPSRLGPLALAGLPVVLLVQPGELGGLGPDLPVALLSYLCLALWALALSAPEEGGWAGPAALFVAAAALSLKLSAAPLLAGSAALAVLARRSAPGRAWRGGAAAGAALLAAWGARSLVASGCLLYPAAASCLPLPWAVPAATARELTAWTLSWARAPGRPPAEVLADARWLGPWAARLAGEPGIRALAAALALGLALTAAARRRPPVALLLPWGAAVAAALFWLATAPDPRFGWGTLAAVALLPLAWGVAAQPRLASPRARRALAGAWLLALALLARDGVERLGPLRLPAAGFGAIPSPRTEARLAADGLQLAVPARGDQCWGAPLPCTPRPDPALRRVGAGFRRGP